MSSQKKTKDKEIISQRPTFWLGYHALNTNACENGDPLEPTLSVSKLVKFIITYDDALEHLEAVFSFPYIFQEVWPSKRIDGKKGGYFNLTQVPFNAEVDERGCALDYQVAIPFKLCDQNFSRDEIYAKTEVRLKVIDIQLE